MSSTFLDPQTPKRISVDLHGRKREIELRLAKPEDALDMVDFHNSYYRDRNSRTPAGWIWEYYTYEPDLAIFAFAKDGDKVIGTQGIMPVYMEVSGRRVLAGKNENILVLAPYRRTSVMVSLVELVIERGLRNGGQFGWGFTPAEGLLKKYGASAHNDIQIWMRPGNIWVAAVSNFKKKTQLWRRIGSLVKVFIGHFSSGKIPEIQRQPDYEIRRGLCDEHDIQELYERLKVKYQHLIFIRYDQKYFQWRIRGHPFLKYDEYQVYQGDQMRAYAFVLLSRGTLYISDLTSEDGHATAVLLTTILSDYSKKAGRFWFLGNRKDFLAQDVFEKLYQLGFSFDAKTSANWVFGVIDIVGDKDDLFFDMRNWHITGLWTEGFPY